MINDWRLSYFRRGMSAGTVQCLSHTLSSKGCQRYQTDIPSFVKVSDRLIKICLGMQNSVIRLDLRDLQYESKFSDMYGSLPNYLFQKDLLADDVAKDTYSTS